MPLKSREYEDRIKSIGFERATKWATMEVIERHNMLEKSINECGSQLLAIVEILDRITDGTAMLRRKVEQLVRRDQVDEAHPTPSDDKIN